MKYFKLFSIICITFCILYTFNQQLASSQIAHRKGLFRRDNSSSSDNSSSNDNSSNNDNDDSDASQDGNCNQSTNVGMFLLTSPNQSVSVYFIGLNLTIKWSYSKLVTKLPGNITLSYQNTNNQRQWTTIDTVSGGSRKSYNWLIPDMAAGSYRLKLVADGKDNTVQPATPEDVVCYSDGEVMATITRPFKITDNTIPDSTTNPYPPNSAVGNLFGQSGLSLVILMFSLIWNYLSL